MSEKTDRVTWQVTDTTGVPILGRAQAKIMNYISYSEIHALQEQEQAAVSQNSLKSADYIHSLETLQCSLQSKKTAQSMDSLQSTPSLKRLCSLWTVYSLHPVSTRLHRKSTELQPRQNQVLHMNQSLHKLLGVRIQ